MTQAWYSTRGGTSACMLLTSTATVSIRVSKRPLPQSEGAFDLGLPGGADLGSVRIDLTGAMFDDHVMTCTRRWPRLKKR
jgi:hypothetical protein